MQVLVCVAEDQPKAACVSVGPLMPTLPVGLDHFLPARTPRTAQK